MRVFEESLSKDIVHINSIDEIARDKNNIIFLGNSLTRHGIDKNQIRKLFSNRMHVGYIYPDDTSIIEWYYIFKSYFIDNNNVPDNIVICFAIDQLKSSDIEFEEIQRISKYVPLNRSGFVIDRENLSLAETIDFYLCKSLNIYANRERLSKRVLNILPKYRQLIRSINNNIPNQKIEREDSDYSHFTDMIQLADSVGCNILFCAMPIPKNYSINDEIISTLKMSKYCKLYDFRDSNIFSDIHFLDGYHLNEFGATIFTTHLIDSLQMAN
mgnify:FL=1|tara:strand:- start:2544 stop:3353 length:810 start_codon:yes stop_codon:yes gene_type:complete